MRHSLLFLSILAPASFVDAQQVPLSGPVEAFTFDAPTASLRAIQGRLGSSSLGPAVLRGYDFGSVAPRRSYGLVFQNPKTQNGKAILVAGLDSDQPVSTEIGDISSAPEGVAWSEDGSLAVLYSRTGNWMQTVKGLPANPNLGSAVSLAPLAGSLSAIAADAQGSRVVVGIAGDAGGVYDVTDGRNFVPLLAASKPLALAFSADGKTLFALDGALGQLSAVSLTGLGTQPWLLSELQDPFAIRTAFDAAQRQVLYVAGRSDRLLVAYDLQSRQAIASVALDFAPAAIEPLGQNSFLLRSRTNGDDPLWSFTNAPQPVVYFVPATPLAISGGSQ